MPDTSTLDPSATYIPMLVLSIRLGYIRVVSAKRSYATPLASEVRPDHGEALTLTNTSKSDPSKKTFIVMLSFPDPANLYGRK